jgi:hypothetical protein
MQQYNMRNNTCNAKCAIIMHHARLRGHAAQNAVRRRDSLHTPKSDGNHAEYIERQQPTQHAIVAEYILRQQPTQHAIVNVVASETVQRLATAWPRSPHRLSRLSDAIMNFVKCESIAGLSYAIDSRSPMNSAMLPLHVVLTLMMLRTRSTRQTT